MRLKITKKTGTYRNRIPNYGSVPCYSQADVERARAAGQLVVEACGSGGDVPCMDVWHIDSAASWTVELRRDAVRSVADHIVEREADLLRKEQAIADAEKAATSGCFIAEWCSGGSWNTGPVRRTKAAAGLDYRPNLEAGDVLCVYSISHGWKRLEYARSRDVLRTRKIRQKSLPPSSDTVPVREAITVADVMRAIAAAGVTVHD